MDNVPPLLPPTPPPPGPYPGYPYLPPQPSSWISRNWPWFVPVGCVGTLALLAVFGAVIAMSVFGLMKNSEPYQTSLTRARANPQVAAALGTPIKETFYVWGQISTGGHAGSARLVIPLSGPKAKARLFVNAVETNGEWKYSVMRVRVQGSTKSIDLLGDER